MWVRIFLGIAAVATWAATFWMGSHVSGDANLLGRWSGAYAAVVFGLALFALLISALQLPRPFAWVYARRYQFLALLIVVGICLGGVEFLVRALDPLGISYYAESSRYHLEKIADPELYYRHRGGFRDEYQDVDCWFNEQGFRDDPIEAKQPGEFRVLFVGDSVTFGWGVAQRETYAARAAALLTDKLGRPVRTINGGCGSYNSAQEYAFIRRYVPALSPDLVVLTYVSNDATPTGPGPFDPWSTVSLSGKSPPETLALLAYRSWTYRLVRHVYRHAGGSTEEGSAGSLDDPNWADSFDSIARSARFCREAGVPFVLALWRMAKAPPSDAIAARLRQVAERERFPFVDFADGFEGNDPVRFFNSVVDSHPNSEGHVVAAEFLVDECERTGVLAPR